MLSPCKSSRARASSAERLLFIVAVTIVLAVVFTALPDDCLAAAKRAARRGSRGYSGSIGFPLSFFLLVAMVAAWYGAKIVAKKLIEFCARAYQGVSGAMITLYFVKAANLNLNLLAILTVVSAIYYYAYDDPTSFVVVGYLIGLLSLWLLTNLIELRRGGLFSSEDGTAELLRYVRTNMLRAPFKQELIETRAKRVGKFRVR